ncbi:MAG: cysteine desulfurase, partial [Clostridia bacterium]|nr:cysteine desulfurase [Clostridia bacterium]
AGRDAAALVSEARNAVARSLGLRKLGAGELVFTSCGSEADSLAILGVAHAKERRTANRIVTTDSEHPAVENVMQRLEREGFEVVRIPTRGGALDMDAVDAALDKNVLLVSMMLVNNETGARYDLKRVFSLAKARAPQVVTHTDAVQGYLKGLLTPASLGADLISISAHKVHGPKGVGALYINPALLKAKQIVPFLLGGGQESGLRSGTENVIGIASFGAAVASLFPRMAEDVAHMTALRDETVERLAALGIAVKLPSGDRAPHIINLTLPNIKSETMLHHLDARGVCVSSGSACASNARNLSHALLAFGCSEREVDCSLRVSLCPENTREDIDALIEGLSDGLNRLIRIK